MASLPCGGAGDGDGAASASGAALPPLSASPSLAGYAQHAAQQQAHAVSLPQQVQLQLPYNIALHSPLLPLAPGGGGGAVGGGAQAPHGAYFTLPFIQQQGASGGPQGVPLHHFSLPVTAGQGALGSLSLGWPMTGDGSGGSGGMQLPPSSSGILAPMPAGMLHQQTQQQMQLLHHQQVVDVQQQALSAPQIMSNTDHGGSTEGTHAWNGAGGGHASGPAAAGSARGAALQADDSAAAESRLKAARPGRRGTSGMPRKSQFRGVQWDRNGNKWRARIHTDKTRHIGYFENEEEAGKAWDQAALRHFGETAEILTKLNFREQSVSAFRQQQAAAQPGGGATATATAGATGTGGASGQSGEAAARSRGQASPMPSSQPGCPSGSGQQPDTHVVVAAVGCGSASHQQQQWQRQEGSLPPTGLLSGAAGTSSQLHTPAVLPQPSPKRRRLGESSVATGPSQLLPPPHGQHHAPPQQAAGGFGMAAGASGGAGMLHSPPEVVGSHDESGTFCGVQRQASGGREEWRAYLSLDLGRFASAEEAARAHDRAALLAAGFQGSTNFPLADAFAAGVAAAQRGARQAAAASAGAQEAQPQLRGVALRAGGWLALLDIGGSPYELGPYSSELAAAQAYDRYSLLLNGVQAQTNFPPWHYLADPGECQALLAAVAQVQQQGRGSAATPQGNKMPTPPSADREQQQQHAQQQQQHGSRTDPRSLQHQQEQLMMMQQQLGMPPSLGDLYAPMQQQHAQRQQQQQQFSQEELARAAGLPDLPPAADLGSQLARLHSMRALQASGSLSADAATAAVAAWGAAGGQSGSGVPPSSMGL